jgi:hypothetical protein
MLKIRLDQPGSLSVLVIVANFLLAAIACIPLLLRGLMMLAILSTKYLDGLGAILMMGTFIAVATLGKIGYQLCIPVFILGGILILGLLLNSKVPWIIKLATAAIELAAFCGMYQNMSALIVLYQRGLYKFIQ